MAQRPRIQWRVLDGADDCAVWTLGWLPDTDVLRWSLANSLRIEGVRDGWHASYEASDAARFEEAWIAEDEYGDTVRVDAECKAVDGTWLPDAKSATIAFLPGNE